MRRNRSSSQEFPHSGPQQDLRKNPIPRGPPASRSYKAEDAADDVPVPFLPNLEKEEYRPADSSVRMQAHGPAPRSRDHTIRQRSRDHTDRRREAACRRNQKGPQYRRANRKRICVRWNLRRPTDALSGQPGRLCFSIGRRSARESERNGCSPESAYLSGNHSGSPFPGL